MLELPTRNESSMTVGSRVSRKFGNTSYKFLPSTDLSECRLTRAIQSFQATMRLCASRTRIPTSNASKACLIASFDTSPNIASGPPSSALEGVANDFLKHGDRQQVPGQRSQAAGIARPVHTDGKNGDQASLRKLRPRRQPPTTVLSTDRGGCHRRRYKSRVRRRNRGQVLRIKSSGFRCSFPSQTADISQRALFNHPSPCARGKTQRLFFRKRSPKRLLHTRPFSAGPHVPQAKTSTDQIVYERHVTQRRAYSA